MELETHLSIGSDLAFLAKDELEPLVAKITDVGKMLNRLI